MEYIQMRMTDLDTILEREVNHRKEQLAALTWQAVGKAPVSTGLGVIGYSSDLATFRPRYPYAEQYRDKEKMFQVQIQKAEYMRYSCIGRIPGLFIESKGLIETMLGATLDIAPGAVSAEELWVLPCPDDLKDIVDRGLPSRSAGWFPTMREFTEYFRDHLPEGFYLSPTCGGLLSPFATAASILGAPLYTEIYDRPDLVHGLLDLITETSIVVYGELYKLAGFQNLDCDYYFGSCLPGVPVAGDDVVGISAAMIREFEIPYLQKLAKGLKCKIFYHYCPSLKDTRDKYTDHPLKAIIPVEEIVGLNSQPLGYWGYLDHYSQLREHRVGIQSYLDLPDHHSDEEFVQWVERMHHETYGRSGIHLTLRNVISSEETRRFFEIWNSL
jgi:hypothetical protein